MLILIRILIRIPTTDPCPGHSPPCSHRFFLCPCRDPSAFESLSSVLTGVSSYVASNFPATLSAPSKGSATPSSPAFPTNSTNAYYYPTFQGSNNSLLGGHQDNLCVLTNGDVVIFSAFDWIDYGSLANVAKNRSSRYVKPINRSIRSASSSG